MEVLDAFCGARLAEPGEFFVNKRSCSRDADERGGRQEANWARLGGAARQNREVLRLLALFL